MFFNFKLTKKLVLSAALFFVCVCILGTVGVTAGIAVSVHGEQEKTVQLPVIMYHGVLKDPSQQGKYVVSPDVLEKDLQYLKANGYTSVLIQDILDFVHQGTPLPEKPILITFDDGYYNNYLYAFPLAKQYQMKMVISPIGYYTDKYSESGEFSAYYSHISWDHIREMIGSGYVEIQNHTYFLHSNKGERLGAQKLTGESVKDYQTMLREDLSCMQQKMTEQTGYTPTTFVYPFGAMSEDALPVLQELGFQATLTCESRINTLTRDPQCLFGLGRYLRPAGISIEAFFSSILP